MRVVATQRLQQRERAGIPQGVPAETHRNVVAAVLALDTQRVREPPHRGVVEEHRLQDRLDKVHQVIVSPHVRELVGQDCTELRGCEAGHQADRNEDHGSQPSDHHRHLRDGRLDDSHGRSDRQLLAQLGDHPPTERRR